MIVFICFFIKQLVLKNKRFYLNKQIYHIETPTLLRYYKDKYKRIYNNNNNKYFYKYIIFIGYKNNILVSKYKIIRYINRLIYKFRNKSILLYNVLLKYTKCKINIPNKYELIYYSNNFLMNL